MCVFFGGLRFAYLDQVEKNFKILHVVNGYTDWYDASAEYGFRAVTIHFVFEPKTLTFGRMIRNSPKAQAYFNSYVWLSDRLQCRHGE